MDAQQTKGATLDRVPSGALINNVDQLQKTQTSNVHASDTNEMGVVELRRFVETLKEENALIRKEMKRKEDLNKEISGYLKDELQKTKTKMSEMERTIDEYKEKFKQADEAKRVEAYKLKQQYENDMIAKDQAIADFQQQMGQLDKIKLEKRFSDEIAEHRLREINELRQKHSDEMMRLKSYFEELKKAQDELHRQQMTQKDFENEQKTISQIGEKTREIRLTNIEILKHSKKCEEDFVTYGKAKEQLEANQKQLHIEQKLHKDAIKMYATKSILLAKEIKEGKQKILQLEESLTQAMEKIGRADREKQDLRDLHQEELKAKDNEIELLRARLKKRTNELVRLKKVAKKILSQRSELEGFFMEALEHVQNEKARVQRQSRQSQMSGLQSRRRSKSMREDSSYKPVRDPLPRIEQVPVSRSLEDPLQLEMEHQPPLFPQLSWDEKEQVISLLFNKLSTGIGQGTLQRVVQETDVDDGGRIDWIPHHHTTPATSKPGTSQGHRRPATGGTERPNSKVEFFVTEVAETDGQDAPTRVSRPSSRTSTGSRSSRRLTSGGSALSQIAREGIDAVKYNPPD